MKYKRREKRGVDAITNVPRKQESCVMKGGGGKIKVFLDVAGRESSKKPPLRTIASGKRRAEEDLRRGKRRGKKG